MKILGFILFFAWIMFMFFLSTAFSKSEVVDTSGNYSGYVDWERTAKYLAQELEDCRVANKLLIQNAETCLNDFIRECSKP